MVTKCINFIQNNNRDFKDILKDLKVDYSDHYITSRFADKAKSQCLSAFME